MRKLFFLFTILLWVCGAGVRMYAVPAQPQPRTIIQPDGTSITILLKGDEFFHYTVSEDNYLIAQDADGIYRYAGIDEQGEIYTLEMKVTESKTRSGKEKDFLKNQPNQAQLSERIGQLHTAKTRSNTAYKQTRYPLSGIPKALVILVEYTDVKFLTKHTSGSFVDMLNKQGYSDNGAMGSARDYFRDNSMGVFDPEFVVAGPYTLPNNMAYYGRNSGGDDVNVGQMIIDACRLADNDVNFSEFDTDGDGYVDNVFVFYAGYNEAEGGSANSVWPQRWTVNERVALDGVMLYDFACTSELRGYTGSEMCGIGTFVHEFGHVLDCPIIMPRTAVSMLHWENGTLWITARI